MESGPRAIAAPAMATDVSTSPASGDAPLRVWLAIVLRIR